MISFLLTSMDRPEVYRLFPIKIRSQLVSSHVNTLFYRFPGLSGGLSRPHSEKSRLSGPRSSTKVFTLSFVLIFKDTRNFNSFIVLVKIRSQKLLKLLYLLTKLSEFMSSNQFLLFLSGRRYLCNLKTNFVSGCFFLRSGPPKGSFKMVCNFLLTFS